MSNPPTSLSHVLEMCLYVKDINVARDFYTNTLGLKPDLSFDRITTYPIGNTVLILFALGGNMDDMHPDDNPEQTIPRHGPRQAILDILNSKSEADVSLKQHYCLAVQDVEDVKQWEAYFAEKGVPNVGVMKWPRGGRSVYFEDPDGHVGEIASRGIWPHY